MLYAMTVLDANPLELRVPNEMLSCICCLGYAVCHRDRKEKRTEVATGSGAKAVTGLTILLG